MEKYTIIVDMNSVSNKNELVLMTQKHCLQIVKVIDQICRENEINYSLCGGSVIGAYLYKGFIPWDDDIDIMMTRENYERFLNKFSQKAPKKLRLLNYRTQKTTNIPTLFSRIEDLSTEVEEEIAGHRRKGHVFVDITVMDNVSSKIMHKVAFWFGSYVYMHLYKWNGMIPGTPWKKLIFNIAINHLDVDKTLALYERFDSYCKRKWSERTPYCAELLSAAYSNYLYERSIFDEYDYILFEDTRLMIVKRYMDYLFARYHKREFSVEVPENQRFNSHIIAFKEIASE